MSRITVAEVAGRGLNPALHRLYDQPVFRMHFVCDSGVLSFAVGL